MAGIEKWVPRAGLNFKNLDDAWQFWLAYGGRTGFDVRKRGSNISKIDRKATSCRFVCSNEGVRRKGQTDHVAKIFRAETRTNCEARMVLSLNRLTGNYEVIQVVLQHNHLLHLPQTRHLMASQRKISEIQAFDIETADDTGIRPKQAHELACRRVGGTHNIKRTRTFMEKLRKGKRKPTKSAPSTTKGAKQPKKDVVVQPQVEVQNDGNKKEAHVLHEEYNVIGSFTQLLSAPTCDDDSLYDENIF